MSDNIIINIGYNCSSYDILKKFNLKTYSYRYRKVYKTV